MNLCKAFILLLQLLFLFIDLQSTVACVLPFFFFTKLLLSQLLPYYLATTNTVITIGIHNQDSATFSETFS